MTCGNSLSFSAAHCPSTLVQRPPRGAGSITCVSWSGTGPWARKSNQRERLNQEPTPGLLGLGNTGTRAQGTPEGASDAMPEAVGSEFLQSSALRGLSAGHLHWIDRSLI